MFNKGQSIVEYILLLVIIMSIMIAIIQSRPFQDFFGEDSDFFDNMTRYVEYSYRHARSGSNDNSSYNGIHDSYNSGNESRFFSPAEKYPQ